MIKSMTGYGKYEISEDSRKITVELKSVNHRYLDVNIRMPRKFNSFEHKIRNLLKTNTARGKVDIFINYEDTSESQVSLHYNKVLAEEYMNIFEMMEKDFEITNDIRVSTLSHYTDVIVTKEQVEDAEELWSALEVACRGAFNAFSDTRLKEGKQLESDILCKLERLTNLIALIEARDPELMQSYRTKLETKVSELLIDTKIDEGRLATELVLYADKICTDEETVRLKSHITHMFDSLKEEEGVGRKLDFIAQEMNREANTILSKANDMETSNYAIDLKTEIEKIREQIQNIE